MNSIKILVIGKSAIDRRYLQPVIDDNMDGVVMVNSTEGVLQIVQETLFDLVILDICLLKNENFDFIRVLKQYLNHSQIIVVSENNSKELETAVRKTGIAFYMLKPVDMKYLNSIVAHISTKLGTKN
ncbi:MAG: response regulator [Deltaproteobacteria bacterium]|jgi:CheY-like chemotaxis protein|nr:response regulator [Deltaproteobacteria bacterium]MBT4644633.1 response regulator [Deltaproteobacteria bacterium]MBT6501565.1 response regulator [Deltaproteobacteria bacterium]